MIAIDGAVPGLTLLGGRYGTLRTNASVLELRGARRIAYTFFPVNFCTHLKKKLFMRTGQYSNTVSITVKLLLHDKKM